MTRKTDSVLFILSAVMVGLVVWFYASAYQQKKHAKCPTGTKAEVLRNGLYCVAKPVLE